MFVWFSYYSTISSSVGSVTFFIWFLNVALKWHVIYAVFLAIDHCYLSLVIVIAGNVLYAFLLCVTCTVSSSTLFNCSLWVYFFLLCLLFKLF